MSIFNPERSRATSPRAALVAACRAVSVAPPVWPDDDLVAVLERVESLDAVRADVAAAVKTAEITDEWVSGIIDRLARAQAAQQLRFDAAGAMAGRRLAQVAPEGDLVAGLVAKPTTKLMAELEKLAATLPARAPLDDAAAVAAGAGGELKSARDTLATLATVAEIHRPWTRLGDVVMPEQRPGWRWLLCALVDVELVDVEQRAANESGHRVLNPSPVRASIRKLIEDAGRDLDLVVVDVARARYEGVTLSWAADRAAVHARLKRLEVAESRVMKAPERTRVAPPVSFASVFGPGMVLPSAPEN